MQIPHFRCFIKTALFDKGQKHGLPKTRCVCVCATPTFDKPHPTYLPKRCPRNTPKKGTFTENYSIQPPKLCHANPHFHAITTDFIGDGPMGVFNLLTYGLEALRITLTQAHDTATGESA